MKLNTDCMVPIEEVAHDFSKAAGIIDAAGVAVVIKDNKPRYIIIDYSEFVSEQIGSKESIEDVANRIAAKNQPLIEQLSVNENDIVMKSITVEDILSLNDDYRTDDIFGLDNNIKEEKIFNLNDNTIKKQEIKNNNDEEMKLNLKSYTEDTIYLDDATKKTIAELKELLKG